MSSSPEEHPEEAPASSQAVSNFVNSNPTQDNKWSKNGFGEACPTQGGKFLKEESELVKKAVEDYCAMKQISTARLCSECDHKAELKGAWMEIAKQLPHRTVQSVYRHGLRQLHPFKRGPWTDAECQQLQELVTRMGKKWSSIQSKLQRSSDSCRDKYREMNSEYVKGRWKENETELLKRLIREHLRADPNADIKDLGQMVENEGIIIPWSTISKRMAKRSRLSCFKKWQKMTGLISPSDAIKSSLKIPSSLKTESAASATATAAAVAAAAQVIELTSNPEDIDMHILSSVANSNVNREIDWAVIVGKEIENPEDRWNAMVDEWQDEDDEAGDLLTKLRVCEVAQLLLSRKQGDAKLAAETVEAVDLPPVPIIKESV